ncbi:hypothetical protein ASPACDRAFT_1883062 [Aspergillus aculeatus ATCC 16872]|uniref:Peptidase C14 caspase domain-containing protein n=1 Tax=Aspergillus aculeatus (strain ATCC 16872 / CBS 172.66 / WB 5094) TaxID=690307 RepID=A0A1L9WJJ3_ASPA1|nr:uncharacterized protein ASPACDRAFT_1883062 [Aspergillus aculeatus ATCC 16872]OJJ96325.1 hypothetical protein ASPACDRAFT_1883062 [Aspergillus aculeatus ATCC 16872]
MTTPAKRALIITSPWGDLRGTQNDRDCMQSVLAKYGFQVAHCHGAQATRTGILEAWKQLISETGDGDSVAIYYSGHGGLVESAPNTENAREWRYQFLVPVDFDDVNSSGFNGILDVELSQLLRATTARTRNVTVILDCCFSGRMVRAPGYGDAARPKQVPSVRYEDVAEFVTHRVERVTTEMGEASSIGDDNPDAVRIVAAAPSETAWEVRGEDGRWMGSFTSALAQFLTEAHGHQLSWRTSILRVQELVQAQFPTQHPRVEGPHTRIHFSLDEVNSEAIHLKIENGLPVLQAGFVAGVSEGDVYAVTRLTSERFTEEQQIAVCEVINVQAFQALVQLHYPSSTPTQQVPREGALAFLQESAPYRWPISVPPSLLESLSDKVQKSRFLRLAGENEPGTPLLSIYHRDSFIGIESKQGLSLTTRYLNSENPTQMDCAYQAVLAEADRFACAQRLLGLRNNSPDDLLNHQVDVKVGLVENHQPTRSLAGAGCDELYEGRRIYIALRNDGMTTTYVTVLHINAQGKISLISRSSPFGIELPSGRCHWIRKTPFGVLEGLKISWPADVPRASPIDEHLLFFITSTPVDLRPITDYQVGPHRTATSNFERIIYRLCQGERRDLMEDAEPSQTAYDIIHFPLTVLAQNGSLSLHTTSQEVQHHSAHSTSQTSLNGRPSMLSDEQELPALPPHLHPESRRVRKGIFGQALRSIRGVPACVWVINEHTEPITVVVSPYRPSRLWTEAGLNVSTTGVGIDISTATFTPPATRKTLPAAVPGQLKPPTAVFPLWTRRDGFGVITVLVGATTTPTLYIENDRIPIGATAYFRNEPDLHVKEYSTQ